MFAADGAVDPFGFAGSVVFLFPDGDAGFDFIDDVAAGVERFATMGCADADPDGDVADIEETGSVDTVDGVHAELLDCFVEDALALFDRDAFEGLVFEPVDLASFVVIADPAFERDTGAGRRGIELRFERDRIDGGV